MRIYDQDSKRVLDNVTLFLTPQEAGELGDMAKDLSKYPEHHHHHLTDFNSGDEITVAVYTLENRASFDGESRQVINGKP